MQADMMQRPLCNAKCVEMIWYSKSVSFPVHSSIDKQHGAHLEMSTSKPRQAAACA